MASFWKDVTDSNIGSPAQYCFSYHHDHHHYNHSIASICKRFKDVTA